MTQEDSWRLKKTERDWKGWKRLRKTERDLNRLKQTKNVQEYFQGVSEWLTYSKQNSRKSNKMKFFCDSNVFRYQFNFNFGQIRRCSCRGHGCRCLSCSFGSFVVVTNAKESARINSILRNASKSKSKTRDKNECNLHSALTKWVETSKVLWNFIPFLKYECYVD